MQIVTDSGTDVTLATGRIAELNIHIVPLVVSLDGLSYREGVDIQPDEFYRRLEGAHGLPATSQPAAGEFAALYRRLALTDPEILSIHMSSGLSGTLNAAQAAAELVPEAHVTHFDTKTLSAAAGWQVAAAARAAHAGWSLSRILSMLERMREESDSIFTLTELQYLVHGGRIGHLKGLVASLLKIKPLIGVEKAGGTYVQLGQARRFDRALDAIADLIAARYPEGTALEMQVVHAHNLDGANQLRRILDRRFDCTWLPTGTLSLVLGAHTGPTMVAVAYAPRSLFEDFPVASPPSN